MVFELRSSGLLYSQENGENIVLFDIIKQYKKSDYSSHSYDQESKRITIEIGSKKYCIQLTEDQAFMYENGIEDQLINKLRDLTVLDKENKIRKEKAEIEEKRAAEEKEFKEQTMAVVAQGELPDNLRGINVYKKELNKSLRSTAADIGKGVLMAVVPAAILIGGILVLKNTPRELVTGMDILGGAMVSVGGLSIIGELIWIWDGDLTPVRSLRRAIESIRINLLKMKDLSERKREIKKLEKEHYPGEEIDDFKRYVLEKKGQETIRAAEYSEDALNEIKDVLEVVKQLPKNEQEQYLTKMINLIEVYKTKRLEMIKSTEKYLFGEVEEVRKLKSAITPILEDIKLDVQARLEKLKEAKNVERQCDSLIIDAREQAFNGWTDDLNAGNMLKAR